MSSHDTIEFTGTGTVDSFVNRDTTVSEYNRGLVLENKKTGESDYVELTEQPDAGQKIFARGPLRGLAMSSFIGKRHRGGVTNTYLAAARVLKTTGNGKTVRVLDSGQPSQLTADRFEQLDIDCQYLGRQQSPHNFVVSWLHDHLVVKERVGPPAPTLTSTERSVVCAGSPSCVVTVSSKDPSVVMARLGTANGARRYHNPTGGLPPDLELLVLGGADDIVCNLQELYAVSSLIGSGLPWVDETHCNAPQHALRLLAELNELGLAGRRAAVCTLGDQGSVVADWEKNRQYIIRLEIIDSAGGKPTPAGAGDCYLGTWVALRETWPMRGMLRDPVAATAVRTSKIVARWIGLARDSYRVYHVEV